MVGKKSFIKKFLVVIFSLVLLVGCTKAPTSGEQSTENAGDAQEQESIKIGITQIVEHPALDGAREGFIAALESEGFKDGENIEIEFQNAQGDMPTAQTIAENFASQKKDMILAIATPTAQAAFNATKEIPILITAVTDPMEAGLVASWEKSGTNVAGTSDATPIEKQFELLKKLIPDAQKVGILFNTSEANSEIQIRRAKEIAPKFDIEIITSGVTNVNEVPQALDAVLKKVDVLYVPTDNMIASAMPLVSAKSIEKKIPVIGAEKAHVEAGALATEGIDYYKLGFQTGLAAVEVINGKNPKDMAITTLEDTALMINMEVAKALNIDIPEDIKKEAELVKDGE